MNTANELTQLSAMTPTTSGFDPVLVEEFLGSHLQEAKRYLAQVNDLLQSDEVDVRAAEMALYNANDHFAIVQQQTELSIRLNHGLLSALHEMEAQRNSAEQRLIEIEAVIDEVVDAEIDEDEYNEMVSTGIAKQMWETGDPQTVIDDSRRGLEARIERAVEILTRWQEQGYPDPDADDDGEDGDDAA